MKMFRVALSLFFVTLNFVDASTGGNDTGLGTNEVQRVRFCGDNEICATGDYGEISFTVISYRLNR